MCVLSQLLSKVTVVSCSFTSNVQCVPHTFASGVISDVNISRWCWPAGGGLNASSRRHSESSPDLRWPRVSRSTIVQLPCVCDPPHTPSTDAVSVSEHRRSHEGWFSRESTTATLLYDAPSCTIQKLQRAENNAARIVLEAPRRFRPHLSWRKVKFCHYMIPTSTLSSKMTNCGDIIRCTVYICVCCAKNACAFEMYVLMFDFYTLTHASIHR